MYYCKNMRTDGVLNISDRWYCVMCIYVKGSGYTHIYVTVWLIKYWLVLEYTYIHIRWHFIACNYERSLENNWSLLGIITLITGLLNPYNFLIHPRMLGFCEHVRPSPPYWRRVGHASSQHVLIPTWRCSEAPTTWKSANWKCSSLLLKTEAVALKL